MDRPNDRQILVNYVSWLRAQGMNLEALTEVKHWLLSHDDFDIKLQMLGILRQMRRIKECKTLAQKLIAERPNEGRVLSVMGWALFHGGEKTLGSRLLEEAVRLHPLDENVLFEYAEAMSSMANHVRAIAVLEAALISEPENPTLRAYLSKAYRSAGQLNEATEQLAYVQSLEGESLRVLALRGRIENDEKRYALASVTGELVLDSFPRSATGYVISAKAHAGLGHYEIALKLARMALQVQPYSAEALEAFTWILPKASIGTALKFIVLFAGDCLKNKLRLKSSSA